VLYGLLLEVLQSVLPIHRAGEWFDALADTIGLLVGAGLTVLFRRYVAVRL
jgi:VanZ family protein